MRFVIRDVTTDRVLKAFHSPVAPGEGETINIKESQYKVAWVQWFVKDEEVECVYLWCNVEK
jgi:hypothetical protein